MTTNNIIFFIAGVLTTSTAVAILKRYSKRSRASKTIFTQSLVFFTVKSMMPDLFDFSKDMDTQALGYEDNKTFRYIEMPDERVYWIDRNKLYYVDISDGELDFAKGKIAKTKNLSEKEVNRMLQIYSSLMDG